MTTAAETLSKFNWQPQPAAQKVLNNIIDGFLAYCPGAARLGARMKHETATRFFDWIDSIHLTKTPEIVARLKEVGFSLHPQPGAPDCYVHEGAIFPSVVLHALAVTRVWIKVDWVSDFLAAWDMHDAEITGDPFGQLRACRVFAGNHAELWVVERHGFRGFEPPAFDPAKAVAAMKHLERFRRRNRDLENDAAGYAHTIHLFAAAAEEIGRDWACDLFFFAEREFWQRRNRAAQVQKARQDRLGLGWANHDHHTYRCARDTFKQHVSLLESMGFVCRESFYAGHEAGWGAQVMEQPVCNLTTFNDVDMSAEELLGDFAHNGFPGGIEQLGTVGLWCALHGQAMLQAGMHHLECQFDHAALIEQLEREAHIHTMSPFTTFPHLRQAFTYGEQWKVPERRVGQLLASGLVTREQAQHFLNEGALGSHLENLERNDGFKGFNQQGVSDIIERTDPRKKRTKVPA
ncbi:MAG: hypothetical protein JSR77_03695 [Planctomycetes bacterium]|nr:hypothetical protein [Planctomycetota bacterium]